MNIWDILVLVAVIAAGVFAVVSVIKGKSRCSGSCENCKQNCYKRIDRKK